MYTAATGMQAQQDMVDVISHNIANINSTAFKRQQAEFQDLMYVDKLMIGSTAADGTTISPGGVQVGLGVRLVSVYPVNTQGNLIETGKDLDIAINGNGYFAVNMGDGGRRYARSGAFSYGPNGEIVNSNGYVISPGIAVPENTVQVVVSRSGLVQAYLPAQPEPVTLGQLELARFMNGSGLRPTGDGLFEETVSSGEAILGLPGEDGFGVLVQKYLEASNVDPVISMTDLIKAQRVYEMNAKALQVAADLWKTLNSYQNA